MIPEEKFWQITIVSLFLNIVAGVVWLIVWAVTSLWEWLFL